MEGMVGENTRGNKGENREMMERADTETMEKLTIINVYKTRKCYGVVDHSQLHGQNVYL